MATVLTSFAALPASAQLLYWDSNGAAPGAGAAPVGGWDSSLFWSLDPAGEAATGAWSPGATAIFAAGTDGVGPYLVTLDGPQAAAALKFEEGAVTLAGLTPGTNLTVAGSVDVSTGASATLSVLLSGATGLVKTGDGLLVLGSTNDFTGNIAVNGGTLAFSADSQLGAIPASFNQAAITVQDSTLRLNAGIITLNANRALTVAGAGANLDAVAGAILFVPNVIEGEGKVVTKTGAGEVGFYGSANKFAKLIIDQGNLRVGQSTFPGSDTSYGAVPETLVPDAITIRNGATNRVVGSAAVTISANRGITLGAGGGVLRNDVSPVSLTVNSPITGPGSLRKEGGQALILNGANNYQGGSTFNAGTSTLNGNNDASGPLAINGNAVVVLNGINTFSSASVSNGRITANTNLCLGSGVVTLAPTGAVTVTLVNATTFSPTNVTLENPLQLNTGPGTIDIAANQGRELILNGKISGTGNWVKNFSSSLGAVVLGNAESDFTGNVTIQTGSLIATANNALGSTEGATTINAGASLAFRGGVNYSAAEPVTVSGTGRLGHGAISNDSGNCTFAGPITLAGDTSIGGAPGTELTLAGPIGETGGARVLTKINPLTLRLSAANAYSGGTTISAGRLIVANTTGSATGSGAVTVGAAGALSGPGAIAGPVTIEGTLAPGASPGTLTTGSETWNGGATYVWEINNATGTAGADPGWDLAAINGTLTIAATSASKLTIDVTSLTAANAPGAAENFDNTADYTWTIARTTGGVTGFDAAAINLVTSNFQNPVGTGFFVVELANAGNDLVVRFVHPPTIAAQPANASAECATGTAALSVTAAGTGPLSYAWRFQGTPNGSTGPTLTITPTTTATVGSYDVIVSSPYGSVTSDAATLSLVDTTLPQITTCAPAQSINADAVNCQAAIPDLIPLVTASDTCSAVTLTQTPAAGTLVGAGTHMVTITAKDVSNNESTCVAMVTVNDVTAPVIASCAPNQIILSDLLGMAALPDLTGNVSASDACGGMVSVTQSPAAGTSVGIGVHNVTLTVKDAANNEITCVATVEVSDNSPPVIVTPPATQSVECTSNAVFTVSVTGATPRAYQWYFNEIVPLLDETNATLTITAAGPANAGGYSVVVTNQSGSVTSVVAVLSVLDTLPPVITTCVADQTLAPTANCQVALPDLTGSVTAADACGMVTISQSPTAGTLLGPGTTMVTFTATDGSNNVATCTAVVTVPGLAPVLVNSVAICPGDTAVLTASTTASSPTYLWTPGGATTPSISVSPASTTAYSVLVTDGVTGCTSTGGGTVTVNEPTLFANAAAVAINDNSIASPYPSVINVSGLTATVCRVAVTLNNLNHDFSDDIDMVLVGPNGVGVLLMSDVGGATSLNGITLTLSDSAALSMPDSAAITSGTYKPTNVGSKDDGRLDTFPAPVPVARFGTNLSAFGGIDPNGSWSLYIVDDEIVDAGTLSGGWSIAITTLDPFADVKVVQSVAPSPVAVGSNVTFTVIATNQGPAGALGVALSDTLPAGVTFVSAVASQGSCTETAGVVSCTLGTIEAGQAATVAITVVSSGTGVLVNSASVTATTTDLIAGNNSASANVTVLLPVVIDTQPLAQTVCEGGSLVFSVSASGEAPFSYQWYVNDEVIPGATASTLTVANALPSNSGNYSVEVQNVVSGLRSGAVLGTVNPTPALTVNSETICIGQSATLTATTSAANPTFLWMPGSLSGPSITVNPTATALYTVMVVDGVTGCSNAANATVTVNPLTVASALPSFTDVCPGTSVTFSTTATGTAPLSYVWKKDGIVLGAQTSASLTIAAVAASDAGTYTVEVTGGCSSVTNSGTLTVITPPVIASQPQNQSTPMGNGAVFSVTASGVALSYQWQLNGTDVPGASASSLAVSNLTLADSGRLYQVVVSNCAGIVTSAAATLTVTPISGIAFDFDTPGQYTNTPYAMVANDWLNSALPTITYESPTGGVGVATGGGGLDLIAGNNAGNAAILQSLTYDFSLPGKTLTISSMVKIKAPANNSRNTQIGFSTSSFGDLDNSAGRSYMTLMLQSLAQPALNYDVRQGTKPNGANTFFEGNGVPVTLTAGRWYRLTATFVNSNAVQAGVYALSGTLEDMGTDGLSAPTTAATFGPLNYTNVDVTSAKNLYAVVRGVENTGVDYRDNIYVSVNSGDVSFVAQPASQTVKQGQKATLRALVDGSGPFTYQWSKNGAEIAGARSWKYELPPATLSDNGAQYTVAVTGPGSAITSDPAVITVQAENLSVVSVGSVEGSVVGVRFSQPVDPVTAANPANYLINGVAAVAVQIYQSITQVGQEGGEGARVLLTPASVLSGAFTVTVQNVLDLSGNAIGGNNSAAGVVAGLVGEDVNPLAAQPVGRNYSFGPGQYEIVGGGADIFGTADSFRFVYTRKTGDFDVKVRVPFLDVVRAPTKAGIEARASLDAFSPHVLAAVNPRLPARNTSEGTTRPSFNVATGSWGNNSANAAFPNVWVRLRRVGNTFLRYSSANGVNWTYDGQTVQPGMPETVYLGLAVCAVAQGNYATAQFENYGDFAGYSGATIAITTQPAGSAVNAGSAATLTVNATVSGGGIPSTPGELTYLWQRSNGSGGWTNVPTAVATNNSLNTGNLFISDNGATYRVIVSAPGAASVTSTEAVITVNDATAPTLTAAGIPAGTLSQVVLTFSEPVSATALATANYTVTNAAGVSMGVSGAAFLGADPRVVVLTTSSLLVGGNYGVRVTDVQDLNGNTIAPAVRTFASIGGDAPYATGPVVVEYYTALTNAGNLTDLVSPARTKFGTPDFVVYSNVFGIHPNAANFPNQGFGDHYGVRMYSYFVPPTTAAYRFSIRADDYAQFLMNTNATDSTNPAGAVAQITMTGNVQVYNAANRVTNNLVAGQRYYMEFRFKESTGGDGGTVAVRTDSNVPAQGEVIASSFLAYPDAIAIPSPVVIELYTGLVQSQNAGNGNLPDFIVATNLSKVVATLPNIAGYSRYFGFNTNLVQVNATLDNYFGRAFSYFVAPSNGLYKFWLRSDDSSELWMNTNAVNSTDPAGARLLGQLPQFLGTHTLMAHSVSLVGGQSYYIEARWREGGGGDGFTLAVRAQSDPNTPPATEVAPRSLFAFPADLARIGPARLAGITPSNPVANDGEAVRFAAVGINGADTALGVNGTAIANLPRISWFKNGVQVFANGEIFTNVVTAADNGALITCVVSNQFGVVSRSTTLTVLSDNTAPTIVSAAGSQYYDTVVLGFSEALDTASAGCLANYRINGLTVMSATFDSGTRRRVSLRTSPQTPGVNYTVTVNGVKDASSTGNLIAANSTANFTAWAPGGGNALFVEIYTNITGTAVDNLVKDSKYLNNFPDVAYYTNKFGVGQFATATGLDNYGARVSGYFMPPSNGLYRFYIRGDDGTQLFMNTNGPSSTDRVLIARNDGANSGTYENGSGNGIVGASISPILSLNQGTAYYMEGFLKEGGGGDHMEVVLRAIDPTTLTPIVALGTPAANDILNSDFFSAPGNPDAVQLTLVSVPPAQTNVNAGDLVTLEVEASVTPSTLIAFTRYQWQRSTDGLTFVDIAGARSSSYAFTPTVDDNGATFRVVVSVPGASASATTLFAVAPDTVGPRIISAVSLDGKSVGVCYSEPPDPASAVDEFIYTINGQLPFDVILQPDGRSVLIVLAEPLTTSTFTVDATDLYDLSGLHSASSSFTGKVRGFVTVDVGAPTAAGFSSSCRDDEIDVIAGGADIWGNADQGHLTLIPREGDFDIHVRVQSLLRTSADTITKAGLMVRETLEANSRTLHLLVNPPLSQGGRDQGESGARMATGGTTAAWTYNTNFTFALGTEPAIPNAWVRIKREGNTFRSYRSRDGVNWIIVATTATTYSNKVYVGLATTAHNNTAPATFAEYRDVYIPEVPVIVTQPTPASQTLALHGTATYSVVAQNPPKSGAIRYQWMRDGVAIAGATSDTFTIADAGAGDSGIYTVSVGNDGGTTTSVPVTLIVNNQLPVVSTDSVTAPNGSPLVIPVATLLANDVDPEGAALSIQAVSGLYPATLNANFNDGAPEGTALYGAAAVDLAGGVEDSGVLRLNLPAASLAGGVLLPDMAPRKRISGFTASFMLRIGDGGPNEPADGFSFNFAGDLPAGTAGAAEEGAGTGLSFCVDNYRATLIGSAYSSGLKLKFGGTQIGFVQTPTWNIGRFVPVTVSLTPNGEATVTVDGTNVFGTVAVPFTPRVGRFGFYGRTGGQFESHQVDDLNLTVLTSETGRDYNVPGATWYGNAYIDNTTGVGGSRSLHLTDNINNQAGSLVLDELTPGVGVQSFTASFKLRIGNGSGNAADGFSFNLASDLPNAATGATAAEEGIGTGLSLCVDNYPTGGADAPSFKLKWGGNLLGLVKIPKWNSPNYVPITVNLDADGTLDIIVDGTNVVADLATPYTPVVGRFGFFARTGGENQTHWLDDVNIAVTTPGSPATFTSNFDSGGPGTVTLAGGQITYTPPPNACGSDRFYYIATDGQKGGMSIGEVIVTLPETVPQPPVIVTCATNRTYLSTGAPVLLPSLVSEIVATDNCEAVVTQSPAAGTTLPVGDTVVTFTATDGLGLTATCQITITVIPQPAFSTIGFVGGNFGGSFETVAGLTYIVQYKDNLSALEWTTLQVIVGDGTTKSFSDPGPVVPNRFYRIVIE